MVKFYQTERFKEQEIIWEEKLKASGFIDAEQSIGSARKLKQYCPNVYRQSTKAAREAKTIYYALIAEKIYTEVFTNDIHKYIMSRVSDGQKLTSIHDELKSTRGAPCYEMIRFIVKRFEYRWRIKNYTAKQMNLARLPIRL